MILYHGTNVDFDTVNLLKSNKYKDFGHGFYLTDIRSQAEQLAGKKAKLFGGPRFRRRFICAESFIYIYELLKQELNCI